MCLYRFSFGHKFGFHLMKDKGVSAIDVLPHYTRCWVESSPLLDAAYLLLISLSIVISLLSVLTFPLFLGNLPQASLLMPRNPRDPRRPGLRSLPVRMVCCRLPPQL
nr:uncharacterized protein LOC118876883 [Drosophila suzukii]